MSIVKPPVETLTDLLRWRAQRHPESFAYTFLPEGEGAEQNWTYAELDRQARAVAAQLQEHMVGDDRALLLIPLGLSTWAPSTAASTRA